MIKHADSYRDIVSNYKKSCLAIPEMMINFGMGRFRNVISKSFRRRCLRFQIPPKEMIEIVRYMNTFQTNQDTELRKLQLPNVVQFQEIDINIMIKYAELEESVRKETAVTPYKIYNHSRQDFLLPKRVEALARLFVQLDQINKDKVDIRSLIRIARCD